MTDWDKIHRERRRVAEWLEPDPSLIGATVDPDSSGRSESDMLRSRGGFWQKLRRDDAWQASGQLTSPEQAKRILDALDEKGYDITISWKRGEVVAAREKDQENSRTACTGGSMEEAVFRLAALLAPESDADLLKKRMVQVANHIDPVGAFGLWGEKVGDEGLLFDGAPGPEAKHVEPMLRALVAEVDVLSVSVQEQGDAFRARITVEGAGDPDYLEGRAESLAWALFIAAYELVKYHAE